MTNLDYHLEYHQQCNINAQRQPVLTRNCARHAQGHLHEGEQADGDGREQQQNMAGAQAGQ